MRTRFVALLLTFVLCLMPWACAAAEDESTSESGLAQLVLDAFIAEDYEAITDMLDESVRAQLSPEALGQAWESVTAMYGAFQGTRDPQAGDHAAALTLDFERGALTLSVAWNDGGRLTGLFLAPASQAAADEEPALPEGVTERDVTLFEGTDRALLGRLTLPEATDAPFVVMVQGSGPSDMDETVGVNHPLRELAWALAELGVGSLRFDKITYAHPELAEEIPTVAEEYLEPTLEAKAVLERETGAERVLLLGHSEGGSLMPWLVTEGGFSGGIALAGTPLPLWYSSYRQNLMLIDLMEEGPEKQATLEQVEAMRVQAEALTAPEAEAAPGETVFGMDAAYLKYMQSLDQIALARQSGVPMLFLWGDADVQVLEEDYDAWLEALGDEPGFCFIRYDGLNHLFREARADENISNVSRYYMEKGEMSPVVALDIAAFIMEME